MIARREPSTRTLAIARSGRWVVVVLGSLSASAEHPHSSAVKGPGSGSGPRVGYQTWGASWQILLTAGMVSGSYPDPRALERAARRTPRQPALPVHLHRLSPAVLRRRHGVWKHANFAVMTSGGLGGPLVGGDFSSFHTIMVAYIFVLIGVVRQGHATRRGVPGQHLYSLGA